MREGVCPASHMQVEEPASVVSGSLLSEMGQEMQCASHTQEVEPA